MTTLDIYRAASGIYTINIDEKTVFSKKLMGEWFVKSEFISGSVLDITIGDYIIYNSETYTINRLPSIIKINDSTYQYSVIFESVLYDLSKKLFISSDGLADFPYNGTADDFITNIVASVNEISPEWTKGIVDDTTERTLRFANESCRSALTRVAEEFGLEYSITGKVISLQDAAGIITNYEFQYGRDLGLYKLERVQVQDQNIVTKVYGFGGTTNIPYTYRGSAKRLIFANPGMAVSGVLISAASGTYGIIEGQFTDDTIYPQRTSTLTDVSINFNSGASGTDFNSRSSYVEDSTIDFDLNDYLIPGLTAKIVFKSGDLGGIECEIWKYSAASGRIFFNPYSDPDGYTVPFYNGGSPVLPQAGDTYTLIDMEMPASYVATAESALLTATQAYLDKNSVPQVVYSLELDPKYIKANSISLDTGDKVTIIDSALGINSLIRISAIEFPLVNPYKIKAVISDFVPYTLQERIIQTAKDNKKTILAVDRDAEERTRLASLRLHQEQGKHSVPMYQGVYAAGTTYYGNPARRDIVKYNIPDDDPDAGELYFITKINAPSESFSGIVPTNTDYWEKFDAQYTSIATQLLFAELAYIDNLGVKYFSGVPVGDGDLAGSVVNTQANSPLSTQWEAGVTYEISNKVSNDGVNYVATDENIDTEPPNAACWDEDEDQPVARIDTVTLTGTGGMANILCNGVTKAADFINSLADTATAFVNLYAADYLTGGVVTSASGVNVVFTANVPGVDFTGSTTISHITNSYQGNVKIEGNEIWENTMNSDTTGVLTINRKGYNGGATKYRHLYIGNGKGGTIAMFTGIGLHGIIQLFAEYLSLPNIPTSNAGLSAGQVYRDGAGADAVLKIK